MNRFLDNSLVMLALLASGAYALSSLGPKSLRRRMWGTLARIAARAQRVFSAKPVYALEWLRAAQPPLGDRTPIQVLVSDAGARAVEELLVGIEHGQFG